MFCPDCGTKNPDDSQFCEQCGVSFAPAEQQAPPPPATVPNPPPAYTPVPPSVAVPQPAKADVGWYGTAGIVIALISTIVIPIIFGPIAIVLGIIGHSKGDPRGKIAIILGIVCMLLGFAISYVLFVEF